jgi:hypothetical protein
MSISKRFQAVNALATALAVAIGLTGCTDSGIDPGPSLKDAPAVQAVRYTSPPRLAQRKPATVSTPTPPKAQPAANTPPKTVTAPTTAQKTAASPATIAGCRESVECLARLNALIADPEQTWMARLPTPAEYSSGTRLFAYRALRTKLACDKLEIAKKEIEWAVTTFSKPVAGLKAGVVDLVRNESLAVQSEIDSELKSRC